MTRKTLRAMSPGWPLYQTGISADGEGLIGGLLTNEDTHGFPLDFAVELVEQRGALVDYAEMLADAGSRGIKRYDRLTGQLKYILKENYQDVLDGFARLWVLESRRSGVSDFQTVCQRILARKHQSAEDFGNYVRVLLGDNDE